MIFLAILVWLLIFVGVLLAECAWLWGWLLVWFIPVAAGTIMTVLIVVTCLVFIGAFYLILEELA